MSASHQSPSKLFQNRFLQSLPILELGRLRPRLTRVRFVPGEVLQEMGQPVSRILFVEEGILALVSPSETAPRAVGGGLIGRESATGLLGVLRSDARSFSQVISLSHGVVYSMPTSGVPYNTMTPSFVGLIHQHLEWLVAQLFMSSVCARQHAIPERLANFLLMTDDRCDTNEINYTQQVIASMLGVRRASVAIALAQLTSAGSIEMQRSHVAIRDRNSLTASSCSCYRQLKLLCDPIQCLPVLDRSLMPEKAGNLMIT